jgi:cytochrome c oxidase accessory protein FixG
MKTIRSYRRKVEWVLILLYLLLPFVKIGGDSALRFDVPTLKLHFFGAALWMQEFYFLLIATFFFVALFLFLTLVFGRVWCGWFCMQTVWCDITEFIESKKTNKIFAHVILILLSLLVGFVTVGYFVSPYELIPQITAGTLGPVPAISMLVLAVLFYLNYAFVRHGFCATICPYAKIQGVLTDDRSLVIQMDPDRTDECIECKMCVRSCPTGLDIRGGMQVSCIMCAECMDACNRVMSKKKKKGLINYSFGKEGVSSWKDLIRPGATIIGLAGILALGALVYQGGARTNFDFSILPHPMEPRVTKEGGIINAYILSVKNKGREDIALSLQLANPGESNNEFHPSLTDPMAVPAGLVEKFPLFVRSTKKPSEDLKLDIILTGASEATGQLSKKVYFTLP